MNKRKSQSIRLIVMLVLTFGFFVVEIAVGYITDSLALISDSYHMLSDFIAIIIGLACVRISYWNSSKNTYGWVRAEVLGALVNSVFLIALCFTILTDGITRLVQPPQIHNVDLLLYVGIAGLGINVFGLIMFCSDTQGGAHGHSHGGGGGGGHGHSHGGKKGKKHRGHSHDSEDNHGHSHDSDSNHGHSHDSGSGDEHSHDHDKADVNCNSRAIEWFPSSVAIVEGISSENSEQQVAVTTIDSDCDIENQTTVEVHPQEEDAISYLQERGVIKSGSQMNMLGVFLHVFGDALGSVVVIASALVIKFVPYDWVYRLDPAMSIIMSIIILSTTIPLFKQSAMVLLQTAPTHIKVSELQEKLLSKVNEITGLHEFHVWQLTGNRIVASGHIRVGNLSDYANVALKVKSFFHDEGIHSTTFQPECNEILGDLELSAEETKRDCVLECGPDKTCFENTCCSNKLKKKKDPSSATNTEEPSQEMNPSFDMVDNSIGSVEPSQETNPSFEIVDETDTRTYTEAPSTERVVDASNNIEMATYSTPM